MSAPALYSVLESGALDIPDEDTARRLVEAVAEHPAFCEWCLAPIRGGVDLHRLRLRNTETVREHANPIVDYLPPGVDPDDGSTLLNRDEEIICACGVIDIDPSETRPRPIVEDAVEHVLTLLGENGAHVDRRAGRAAVREKLDRGETGQFIRTLAQAVHEATSD